MISALLTTADFELLEMPWLKDELADAVMMW
jgi:hypothetical protein